MSLKDQTDDVFPRISATPSAAEVKHFFESIEKGDGVVFNSYLTLHPALLESRDNDTRSTPLIVAARSGNLAAVKQLHESGANLGADDPAGMDALMNACAKGEMPIAQYLVETAGMDAGRKNSSGMTPASCAYGQEFYAMESRMKRYAEEQQQARLASIELKRQAEEQEHARVEALKAEVAAMDNGIQRPMNISKPFTLRR